MKLWIFLYASLTIASQVLFNLENEVDYTKKIAKAQQTIYNLLDKTSTQFQNEFGELAILALERIIEDGSFRSISYELDLESVFEVPPIENEVTIESTFVHDEIIHSEKFDGHSVRIKEVDPIELGLDTVKQHVGYLDVEEVDKHFFFWFFESRNDPKNDPVILWLNGGPGCASEGGLFFELGSSFINSTLQPVFNPSSWNSNASVIYLDQPVGAGYSYTNSSFVGSSEKAAEDVYVFLELFFQKFPQFLKNEFHVAGESYAGHYIPAIGANILKHPERSFKLTSVLIGNGYVDASHQELQSPKMLCGEGGIPSIYTEEQCKVLNENIHASVTFSYLCAVSLNKFACLIAEHYSKICYEPLAELNLNPYDLRRECEDDGLCYKDLDYVADFLSLKSVRAAIGVDPNFDYKFCNHDVGARFALARDEVIPYEEKLAEILDANVPVLLYAGDKDFVCHWVGYDFVSNMIKFDGDDSYKKSEFKPWVKDGKEIGQVRGAEGLTFLRVYESGHMVPHDQPEVALDMLSAWLAKDFYFGY
ncbi:carboxypeptidase Y [[Candida] jaroonii]|uniref:Carboxypeptidase Y n=1 Tax=[Candida] jaroonii TaxID=467808 RepID=A0ACA9Y2P4_9ASCO|nr:carboxypeptidase Y [[Candida] jaroonii]